MGSAADGAEAMASTNLGARRMADAVTPSVACFQGFAVIPPAHTCVQEEEKRYRPGTNKHIAFQVLKAAGPRGLSVPQIMAASKEAGWKDFDDTAKRVIQFVSALSHQCRPPCTRQQRAPGLRA